MKILINADTRLATDPHQWLIQNRRVANGKERWDSVAFYKTLSSAALGLARLKVYDFDGVQPHELETLCKRDDTLVANVTRAVARTGLRRRPKSKTSIPLNEQIRILSDHSQWIVERSRSVRGKHKWDGHTFHQTLAHAVLSLVREQARELDVTLPPCSVEAICQDMDRFESSILAALDQSKLARYSGEDEKACAQFRLPDNTTPTDHLGNGAPLKPSDDLRPTYVVASN
jgi:hypothetical protein